MYLKWCNFHGIEIMWDLYMHEINTHMSDAHLSQLHFCQYYVLFLETYSTFGNLWLCKEYVSWWRHKRPHLICWFRSFISDQWFVYNKMPLAVISDTAMATSTFLYIYLCIWLKLWGHFMSWIFGTMVNTLVLCGHRVWIMRCIHPLCHSEYEWDIKLAVLVPGFYDE